MSDESRQNFLNLLRIRKDLERFTAGALARQANVEELVQRIAALDHRDQELVYRWAELIGQSNYELAVHFINRAPAAFAQMERGGVEHWVERAMTAFDNRGLGFAIDELEDVDAFAQQYASRHVRCGFEDTGVFLRHFVRGLGGRELRLQTDQATFTDTESLFLPDAVNLFPQPEQNFTLYKLTAVHLWAQTWYGTWRYHVVEHLIRQFDTEDMLAVFNRLECIRLDACIERDLPGLAREFRAYGHVDPAADALWDEWRRRAAILIRPQASAEDSLTLIESFLEQPLPPLKLYQGDMFAGKVRQAMFARIEREKAAFQRALQDLRDEDDAEGGDGGDDAQQQMLELQMREDQAGGSGDANFKLTIDGELVNLNEHLQDLMGSIMQDFGEIPDEHLDPLERGEYAEDLLPQTGNQAGDDDPDLNASGTFTYREWDCTRQRFREGFCTLRELAVPPGDEAFVQTTLEKHRGLLKAIKRSFEAVIGETRLQRRQSDGDDIDLDALIEAYSDLANGLEMSEYVYTRYRNQERNIAVMFMVDMSGSTLGWVNDAEREALVLLCEALQLLGDRYAIFGFSGRTNKRCEVYRVKDFDEDYTLEVRQRISGIRPKAYTRMGVAIRHLGQLLHDTHARTKLLITLSDGRPEDYGGYKGKYGIEDTRHALLELRQAGIHAFCITIDNEAQEYLPHMYGPANFAVIDEVEKLPHKVADIYRRLTT
ncbi:MAG: VWA domain-containing protein [Gammaproteobacteria bacterium]